MCTCFLSSLAEICEGVAEKKWKFSQSVERVAISVDKLA